MADTSWVAIRERLEREHGPMREATDEEFRAFCEEHGITSDGEG